MESSNYHGVREIRYAATIADAKTVARKATVEILLGQCEVSRFALVAEFTIDVRLAETVPFAVVGW